MYDIKNKRKFLNRTRQPNLPEQLLIGTKLQIHSRQHCIVDYGDEKTRKVRKRGGVYKAGNLDAYKTGDSVAF